MSDGAVSQQFFRAVDIVQSLPKNGSIQSSYEDKLAIYSLFKQATEGDRPGARPGLFDVLGRSKWDAWNKQRGMSKRDAMQAYVQVLVNLLIRYPNEPLSQSYIKELQELGSTAKPDRRRRLRRDSDASSSSNESFRSSRQSDIDQVQPQSNEVSARHPELLSQDSFLAVSPPGPTHPAILPPVLESPPGRYVTQAAGVNHPSSRWPTESPAYLTRRGSDSSISLGGDAQSHKPSRAPSVAHSHKRNRTSGARNDTGLIGLTEGHGYPLGSTGSSAPAPNMPTNRVYTEWPTATPWDGGPQPSHGHIGAGPSNLQRPFSEASFHPFRPGQHQDHIYSLRATPQSHLRPPFSPGPVDHWRSPHVHASPYTGLATRLQPPLQSRFAQASTAPVPQAQLPPAIASELPIVLEQIQTSLTALHERINSIEYAQTMVLRRPSDSWTVFLRMLGLQSDQPIEQHWDGYHYGSQNPYGAPMVQSGLITRVVARLLGTVRRTLVDASFVLVLASLFVAIVAGIRGRGRGGRRALLQFWMTAMRRSRAVGRSLRGELGN